jgi:hypothetical protein
LKEELLREIANDYLLPFFSGASIEEEASSSLPAHKLVALRDPLSVQFKVNKGDRYRLVVSRSQPFTGSARPIISEMSVISAFVGVLGEMESALESKLKHDLLSTFQRRVVARALYDGQHEDVVLAGIDQMARWGNRLYEGSPISASLGFRQTSVDGVVGMADFERLDLSAVLSNGFDTITSFNFDGRLLGFENLEKGSVIPSFCPIRHAPIAEWTTKKHTRLGLCLNRLGEILVFRQEQMLFARRSGRWHFLTHAPVISQMNVPRDVGLRTSIYETCLDASFARTGACIGVVSQGQHGAWQKAVASRDDHLSVGKSNKTKVLNAIVLGRKFQELDRRTRQELSAIDGALVMSHQGDIHAVGAILKIPGGSTGGGRLAAAKALGRLGLGVKVSQDGGITGFRGESADVAFRVMS